MLEHRKLSSMDSLLLQLVYDFQRDPKPVLKFKSFEEVNPLKFKMGPTVLTQIAYQALSESLQTFSEFKYLTSKNFKNSETLSKIDPNPRKIPSDSCT